MDPGATTVPASNTCRYNISFDQNVVVNEPQVEGSAPQYCLSDENIK